MYHVHVNNYQIETDPEKIFRLEMITNSGEDTFSLLKYVGGDPKLFSGMGGFPTIVNGRSLILD